MTLHQEINNEEINDAAREIILNCLAGALQAHNPHWAVIVDDLVITAIKAAAAAVEKAYPEPSDPLAAQTFADFFDHS